MEIHTILKMAINVSCLQDKGERVAALNEALELYLRLFADFYGITIQQQNEMQLDILRIANEYALQSE